MIRYGPSDIRELDNRIAELEAAIRELEPFLKHTLGFVNFGWPYDPQSPIDVNPRIRKAIKLIGAQDD